jgi:alpha-tubulin suppressor-like RCC1 family protein
VPKPISNSSFRFQSKEIEVELENKAKPTRYVSKKKRDELEKQKVMGTRKPTTTRDLPLLKPNFDFIQCQAGYGHTLLLNSQGQVFSFGEGLQGQLG